MFDDLLPAPAAAPPAAHAEPHRALYLRFRPKRFEDVVGQEHVTRTLRNAVKQGRPAHAYLFTGPRGTGKTSVARILYRAANCDQTVDGDACNACALCRGALEGRALDLVEIDAASNRGIDDIRDLRDKVAYHPGEGRYRVYIIDEAHELTPQAWDALLKTLEEPPPHAMFVLATTEAHKVPATIVSRCQRFDFRRIPFAATRGLLQQVAEREGMRVDPAVLERLALVARGGLRDALSLLDQLEAFAGGEIDMAVARAALSLPSIEAVRGVIDGMTRRDPSTVMSLLSDAAEGGADLRLFAEELVVYLRALLLLAARADQRLSDELPDDEVAWLRARAGAWRVGALMQLIQTLSDALARTRDAQQFQVQTEVALLTACDLEVVDRAASPPTSPSPPPSGRAASPPPSSSPSRSPSPSGSGGPPEAARIDSTRPFADVPRAASPLPAGEPARGESPLPAGEPARAASSLPMGPAAPEESPLPAGEPARAASPLRVGQAAPEASPLPPGQAERGAAEGPAAAPPGAAAATLSAAALRGRWPDVIEIVKTRNPILGSLLGSAHPVDVQDNLLTVAFGTDFNRKSAEKASHRQIIESAFRRVYGTPFRMRCTVKTDVESGANLLDDPVINYATRTFGGQPKRISADQAGL